MNIRPATLEDLDRLMEIYDAARQYMRNEGNTVQWTNGYPGRDVLAHDIKKGWLYGVEEDGELHAAFAFVTEPDFYYLGIDGAWLDDEPYGAIHRVANDGTVRGVMKAAVAFCKNICPHIRIDTHETNATMRHVLEKIGFVECGVIHIADGTPRIAYQLPAEA